MTFLIKYKENDKIKEWKIIFSNIHTFENCLDRAFREKTSIDRFKNKYPDREIISSRWIN